MAGIVYRSSRAHQRFSLSPSHPLHLPSADGLSTCHDCHDCQVHLRQLQLHLGQSKQLTIMAQLIIVDDSHTIE